MTYRDPSHNYYIILVKVIVTSDIFWKLKLDLDWTSEVLKDCWNFRIRQICKFTHQKRARCCYATCPRPYFAQLSGSVEVLKLDLKVSKNV